MTDDITKKPDWIYRGKSVRQLIQELHSFEDDTLEVMISVDKSQTRKPLKSLEHRNGRLLLISADGE
jgi:hypothetical protein